MPPPPPPKEIALAMTLAASNAHVFLQLKPVLFLASSLALFLNYKNDLFQAMLLFTGADEFSLNLLNTFQSLVNDPHAIVRRTVSCGIHEVRRVYLYWLLCTR